MRYIICEDTGSGFYFWSLIKEFVLNKYYKMVTPEMMSEIININNAKTVGISLIAEYITELIQPKNLDKYKDDIFIICIDSSLDNPHVMYDINNIRKVVGKQPNMHMFNYICFEELLLSSGEYINLIQANMNPKDQKIYNILKDNISKFGLGRSLDLKTELVKQGIKFSTTERIFNKLITDLSIQSKNKIGNREYIRMHHHYICKGKWSECWKTDCTVNCPYDKCWEATNKNDIMCDSCTSNLKGKSKSCKLVNNTNLRSYAEDTSCSRQVPDKLRDRIKLLFSIPEILEIDNY